MSGFAHQAFPTIIMGPGCTQVHAIIAKRRELEYIEASTGVGRRRKRSQDAREGNRNTGAPGCHSAKTDRELEEQGARDHYPRPQKEPERPVDPYPADESEPACLHVPNRVNTEYSRQAAGTGTGTGRNPAGVPEPRLLSESPVLLINPIPFRVRVRARRSQSEHTIYALECSAIDAANCEVQNQNRNERIIAIGRSTQGALGCPPRITQYESGSGPGPLPFDSAICQIDVAFKQSLYHHQGDVARRRTSDAPLLEWGPGITESESAATYIGFEGRMAMGDARAQHLIMTERRRPVELRPVVLVFCCLGWPSDTDDAVRWVSVSTNPVGVVVAIPGTNTAYQGTFVPPTRNRVGAVGSPDAVFGISRVDVAQVALGVTPGVCIIGEPAIGVIRASKSPGGGDAMYASIGVRGTSLGFRGAGKAGWCQNHYHHECGVGRGTWGCRIVQSTLELTRGRKFGLPKKAATEKKFKAQVEPD
ncbi:hypothetical protein B0H11DRAFT_2186664 [Mycena galericulata]|nr:hypothetical protein B0H11DRAFT_2186664 [Mycena galericulata]